MATTFYQHRINKGLIMVEAVDFWQENDTIFCIHFDTGLYIELKKAAFDFFILAYYGVTLTREKYKATFNKPLKRV